MKSNSFFKSVYIRMFIYAFNGIKFSVKNERNMKIHIFFGTFAIILSILLKISLDEFAIIVLTISAVIFTELINSSIEVTVNLVTDGKYNKLAGIAKDTSAGAVLISAIASLFVASFIFIPHIIYIFHLKL